MFFKTIEDESRLSGLRIENNYSKLKEQIIAIFSSTNTIQFSSSFTQSLSSDEAALASYKTQLENGVLKQDAFNATMLEASPAAQALAQSLGIADGEVANYNAKLDAFIASQKQSEIATMAQNKSLANTKTIFNTYNSGLEKTGVSQKQFLEAIAKSNPQMAKYLASVNIGKASIVGYAGSVIASTAATWGLRAATMALNAVLGMGIGFIISLITSGLSKWISSIGDSFKSTEEKLSDCNAALKEINDSVSEVEQNFQSLKQSATDIIPRFVELAKGVNSLGEKASLTDDEYEEFLKLNNELARLFPEINLGMDRNGNSILALSYNSDTLADSLQNLIDKERELANLEIAKKIPDAIEKIQNFEDTSNKSIDDYKNRLNSYDTAYGQIKYAYRKENTDYYKELYGDNWETYINTDLLNNGTLDRIRECFRDLGDEEWQALLSKYSDPDTLNIDWQRLLNSDEFTSRVEYFEKKLGYLEEDIEAKWKSMASYMNAWMQTEASFGAIDGDLQNLAFSMVGNIDYGSEDLDEEDEIKDYIRENIIEPLRSMSPEAKAAYNELFSIPLDPSNPNEFREKVKNKIQEIADNSDFDYDELLKLTGYDEILDAADDELASVFAKVSNTRIYRQIQGLSKGFEELDKIFDDVKDKGTFDFSNLLNNDDFDKAFSGLGDSYSDFIEAVANSPDDLSACQDAFNNLVTAYIESSGILNNLSDATRDTTVAMLEQMGVANAAAIVDEQLALAKERAKLASEEYSNMSLGEILKLYDEAEAGSIAEQALAELAYQKFLTNGNGINTAADVQELINLATNANATADSLRNLAAAKSMLGASEKYGAGSPLANFFAGQAQKLLSTPLTYNTTKASYGGGSAYNKSGSGGSSKDSLEEIDWIEIALNNIKRAIDKLKSISDSAYKSLSTKLKATSSELASINEQINTQEKAYKRYMQEADSVGLSSELAEKVRNGAIDINKYDKETRELIKNYQTWYNKAIDCSDAIDDLRDSLAGLYSDRFNNIADDFSNQLDLAEHLTKQYENGLDLLEAKGYLESTKYYSALQDVTKSNITILNKELSDLKQAFSDAMNSDTGIEKYGEEWYSFQTAINGVKEEIAEAEIELAKYAQTMREIEWGYFDFIQERIEQLTKESEFLIDLMSNADLFTDKGQLTDEGMATIGLHIQNQNVFMSQADQYAQELLAINAELANDPNNTKLIERKEELLELQQEAILAAEGEKQAIVSLVEDGIQLELDSLRELIDSYVEAAESAKD